MEQKVIYSFDINQNYSLKELYENFIKEYSINLSKGPLLISERILKDGIEISPERKKEKIIEINPLKKESELETKLYTKNENFGFRIYKTKEGKFIEVNYIKFPSFHKSNFP